MITLAVVSILVGVALPSFSSSVRKGRRADAADATVGVLQAQERWRAGHASYSTQLVTDLNQASTTSGGYYSLAVSAASGTGYTLTASAVGGKGQDKDTGCTALVVTVTNGSPAYTPATCWSR